MRHDGMPFSHPDRPPLRFDLTKAWKHFRQFQQDIERTREVFHLFEALPWTGVVEAARHFLSTERGQAIFASEPFLPDILDDHNALRRLPEGSLAHDYCDYMEHEKLSAAGLVAEYETFRGERPRLNDQVEWYVDRLRDTHDLLHILTGFGRDALGEQCLGTFIFKQRVSIGHLVLGYGGSVVIRKHVKSRAPVMRAVHEARRIGKSCPRIAEHSILELLALPTDQVRTMLNLRPPHYYNEVHRIWRSDGIDPFKVLQRQAAA
jgi:ubiquinone biosynthesis protein COQ4